MVAAWEVKQDEYRRIYHLRSCESCDGSACVGRTYRIKPLGYDWPACPVSLTRSGWWQYIVALSNAKVTNPLAGWPHRFAAWVVDGMTELEAAINRKRNEELKRGNQ